MRATGADILIIGGSAEAVALAARLGRRARAILPPDARLAQRWPVPVVARALSGESLDAALTGGVALLVDASHPNDARASRLAAAASARHAIPLLRLERPEWRPTRDDRWTRLRTEAEAARHVARGSRLFLATGRETLKRFACLREVHVFARQITEHDDPFPLPRGRFLCSAAPFTVAQEVALFRRLRIDWLVLRNAGGQGGWPKVEAARRLGLRVGMIDRPRLPEVPVVRDVKTALQRIEKWQI